MNVTVIIELPFEADISLPPAVFQLKSYSSLDWKQDQCMSLCVFVILHFCSHHSTISGSVFPLLEQDPEFLS